MTAPTVPIFNQSKQAQIDQLNHEATQCQTITPLKTITLAQEALALSEDVANFSPPYLEGIIDSHVNLSYGYYMRNKLEDALRHALIATTFSTEGDDQQRTGDSHIITGYCYSRLGNYPKAVTHFQVVITIGQEIGKPLLMASSYLGLAEALGEIGELQKAVQYTVMGLSLFQAEDDISGQRNCLSNLCWFHNQQELYAQAVPYGLEALTLCTPESGFNTRVAATNLGQTYLGLKQFVQAHYYFDLAQSIEAITDHYTSSLLLTDQGHTYILQGDLIAAEHTLAKAMHLAIKSESLYCKYYVHQQLSELHKLSGNFEAALFHSEQHRIIRNNHTGEENARRTRYLEITFNVESAERAAAHFRTRSEVLAQQVAERTQALELLTIELERTYTKESELSQLKSRIITTVSHEFRTPLTIINSSVDILNNYYDRLSVPKRGTIHKRIQTAIFYLTDLLQDIDLVNTAKSKQIRPNFSSIPFNQLVEQLTDNLHNAIGNPTNLSFHYVPNDTAIISADFDMLTQVVHNLLSNALKYSVEHMPIDITISSTPAFSITVQDNGIGIPAADIDNIWELFYRGSNINQKSGLGLGLFIAHALTEAMEGTISVQSVEAAGTTFTLTFPTALIDSS